MRTTTHTGRLRRLRVCIQLLVAVLVLTWAPAVAQAAFFNVDQASASVGTYRIPAPTGGTGYESCTTAKTSMTVTITDFNAVAKATGYTVTLTAPSGEVSTNTLGPTTRATTITRTSARTGTFTLRVRANINKWAGLNTERLITCPV